MFDETLNDVVNSAAGAALRSHLAEAEFELEQKPEALLWRRENSSGERLEEVHLHPHFAHAVSYEYRGWARTRDEILERLEPILSMCRSGEIAGLGYGLAYVDVFLNDSGENYDAAEVFAPDTRLLGSQAFGGGESWKQEIWWSLNDGTRAALQVDAKFVDREDESTAGEVDEEGESKPVHLTEVTVRLSGLRNSELDASVQWEQSAVKAAFDHLHNVNKDIMVRLLSEEMIKQIGLRE